MKLPFPYKPSTRFALLTTLVVTVGVLQGCTSLSDNNNVVEIEPVTTEQQLAEHITEWETYKPKIDGLLEKEAVREEAEIAADKTTAAPAVRVTAIPPLVEGEKTGNSSASSIGKSDDTVAPMDASEEVQTMPADKASALPLRADKYVVAEMAGQAKIDEADANKSSMEYELQQESLLEGDTAASAEKSEAADDNYVRAKFQSDKVMEASKAPAKTSATEYGLQLSSHTIAGDAEKQWAKISRKFRTLLSGKEAIIAKATVKNKLYYRLKVGPYYDKKIANDVCKQLVLSHQDCIMSDYYGEPIK